MDYRQAQMELAANRTMQHFYKPGNDLNPYNFQQFDYSPHVFPPDRKISRAKTPPAKEP